MDRQESEIIQIARGVQQGCPISLLLIEMLAIAVRHDRRIKGVKGMYF